MGGAPTPYEAIARAAEVEVGECQKRLSSLRAAQLIRVDRRGLERLVEPYHDRVREAVLGHIEAGGVAPRHLRLGRALLNHPRGEPALVFAAAEHLNAARELLATPEELTPSSPR